MPLLNVEDLKAGMVLNKNVENKETGVILLSSGTVLNRNNIRTLKKLGIKQVDIFEGSESKGNYLIIDNQLNEKYNAFSNKVRNVFNSAKFGSKVAVMEISEELDGIIDVIIKNNNILGRLRQLEKDNDYTFQHSLDVSMLSTMVGKWLGYTGPELKQLSLAGLFHDIGKLKIPREILYKPGKLNEEEYKLVKQHTIFGYNLLKETMGISKNIALGALQHHEREDGSGYPLGLKSNKIHEFAKIIAVCDVFNAMTSNRIYKEKQSPFLVAEHIIGSRFGELDPKISTLFINNISRFYVGNVIKLCNDEIGEIVYVYKQRPTRPVVKVNDKFIDLMKDKDLYIVDVIN